jgi:hypothetical protein
MAPPLLWHHSVAAGKDADARAAVLKFLGAAQRDALASRQAAVGEQEDETAQCVGAAMCAAPRLSPAALRELMGEHRVRTVAAERWLDKARSVNDLRREVQRRGLRANAETVLRAAALAPPPRPGSKKAIRAAAPPGGYVAAGLAAAAAAAAATEGCSEFDPPSASGSSSSDSSVSSSNSSDEKTSGSESPAPSKSDSSGESENDDDAGFRRKRHRLPGRAPSKKSGAERKPRCAAKASRTASMRRRQSNLGASSHANSRLRRFELAAMLIEDDVAVYCGQREARRQASDQRPLCLVLKQRSLRVLFAPQS